MCICIRKDAPNPSSPFCTHELTWVELSVGGHTIRLHDGLETTGELVHLVVGGWSFLGVDPVDDPVDDGMNCGSS